MDLQDLFTIRTYQLLSIDLPCFNAGATDTEQNCQYLIEDDQHSSQEYSKMSAARDLHIEYFCSTAASTDWDLTGQIVWPVSALLSHFVASSVGQSILQRSQRGVVELGAGCGLAGMVASYFCTNVILTDGNEIVMDLLQKNASLRSNVHAMPFTWGNRKELRAILDKTKTTDNDGGFDVVVAADVVQWPTVVEPLLHSVKALLWNSHLKEPCLLLGIVNRAENIYNLFFRIAKELGFAYSKVHPDMFLKDGVIPKSCQEYGGRETEIYIVKLVDRSQPPLLFDDGDDFVDQENWEKT